MTDKEINTNKYFVELTDIGGGTIGYTVPFPEELLREIIKQNKQLKRKTQEYKKIKKELDLYKTWYRAKHGDIKNYLGRCYNALKEIKAVCLKDTYTFADSTQVRYDSLDDILNIIRKVKGEE